MNCTLNKTVIVIAFLAQMACSRKTQSKEFYTVGLNTAMIQTEQLAKLAKEENKIPRTISTSNKIHWANPKWDWTEGFFPGTLWYLYEYSNQENFKQQGEYFQSLIKDHRFVTKSHDLGFVFNCSFGNAYRLTKNKEYKQVIIDASNSLITRFNPAVGALQSWNVDKGWQSKRGWQFPVIIDNMMNLEMLFMASEFTGDKKYRNIAISHADVTIKNHFRSDYSSYHVIDYDSINGNVRHKETAQGYAHESSWARGQAWGLYGYTICYRYTKDVKYLNQAMHIADFILKNKKIPSDMVPYWDYNAAKIPNEPRDASAAAITASALLELDSYSSIDYKTSAVKILKNLSSPAYLAETGTNNHFVLKHSVGSIPHNNEIDVPLNYADYYYIEALVRLNKMEKQKAQTTVASMN